MTATEFFDSIARLTDAPREAAVLAAFAAGSYPDFLFSNLQPVTVTGGGHTLTYYATPDYLAVGTDDDWARMPMTPGVAQAIADAKGFVLPTPRMVDQIYNAASTKLPVITYPALRVASGMEASATFLAHHRAIEAARGTTAPPDELLAGQKKDIVLVNAITTHPSKEFIYGWQGTNGVNVQPLFPPTNSSPSTGHSKTYVDYSNCARLVSRRAQLDGAWVDLVAVMTDPTLSYLVSSETLHVTRYGALADGGNGSSGGGGGGGTSIFDDGNGYVADAGGDGGSSGGVFGALLVMAAVAVVVVGVHMQGA